MATSKTLTPTNVTIQIPDFTDQPDQRVNSNCIDKEADAINALNGNINTLANTKARGKSNTIATGDSVTYDIGIAGIVAVGRGSTYALYYAGPWDTLILIASSGTGITVTRSGTNVTMTNNTGSYIGYTVLGGY